MLVSCGVFLTDNGNHPLDTVHIKQNLVQQDSGKESDRFNFKHLIYIEWMI